MTPTCQRWSACLAGQPSGELSLPVSWPSPDRVIHDFQSCKSLQNHANLFVSSVHCSVFSQCFFSVPWVFSVPPEPWWSIMKQWVSLVLVLLVPATLLVLEVEARPNAGEGQSGPTAMLRRMFGKLLLYPASPVLSPTSSPSPTSLHDHSQTCNADIPSTDIHCRYTINCR